MTTIILCISVWLLGAALQLCFFQGATKGMDRTREDNDQYGYLHRNK